MNIRKQLDVLKRRGTTANNPRLRGNEENKDERKLLEMLKTNLDAYLGNEFDTRSRGNINSIIEDLRKLRPDPKGDISNIGSKKLEEFADRNTITDKPGDEKVWGAVASVLGDKDD